MLDLQHYWSLIGLDTPRRVQPNPAWEAMLNTIGAELGLAESGADAIDELHGFLATVEPRELHDDLVDRIESVAASITAQRGVVDARALPTVAKTLGTSYPSADVVSLWVGDITRLRADVIVNAANQEMLGCRLPHHRCIDNAIHSAAGPRLRDDCAAIIEAQGELEAVGSAKLTLGHALPATYVAHTVGPRLVPGSQPTPAERGQLAGCYTACLDLAAQVSAAKTLAFCGISTGVFAYPMDQAAQVALQTINRWMDANPGSLDRIIIDCFSAADAAVYEEILTAW